MVFLYSPNHIPPSVYHSSLLSMDLYSYFKKCNYTIFVDLTFNNIS